MPDEDKNFGGSLVLDFRKWWRHVKTIYCRAFFDTFCCSGGTISLHHSITPSLLVGHLETPIWEGQGCSSENLNLTAKED